MPRLPLLLLPAALWAAAPARAQAAPAVDATATSVPAAAAPAPSAEAAPRLDADAKATADDAAPAGPAPSTSSKDAPDDPSIAPKIDAATREMAEERAAEAAALDPGASRAEEVFRLMRRAGPASPLHQRLGEVLGAPRALPLFPDEGEMEAAALAEIGTFDIEKARKLYDIPVEMTPQVAEGIHFFQTWGRPHFVRWLGRAARYLPMMRRTLREQGLPEDTVYLAMIESGFSPLAFSWAKAAGLWQFIEPTGRRFGLQVDFWVDQRRDPVKATAAAAGYLKELYVEFGDWRLAWAGYDSGAGTIRRATQVAKSTDFWELARGRVLRQETKHYVPKLMAAALIAKHLKSFGFTEAEIEPQSPLEFEEAEVPEATDLEVVAKAAGIGVEELKELNPELRRWCTPPSRRASDVYRIKLPVGTATAFAQNFAQIAPRDRLTFRVHHVGKGDTLSKVAAQYGSAVEAVMRMNGLHDSRRVKLGSDLVVPVPRSGNQEALAVQARRSGYHAAPAAEEVPAAPPPPRSARLAAAGSQRTVKEGARTKIIYGVAEGDSLWSIARHFDVHVDDLRTWNDFGERRHLRIGQEVVVYAPEQAAGDKPAPATQAEPAPASASAAAPPAGAPTASLPAPASGPAAVAATHPPATASAAAPGAAPAAPPAGGRSITHVIAKGDTLSALAHRYKVTIEDLRRWNNLGQKKLQVGKELTVLVPGA